MRLVLGLSSAQQANDRRVQWEIGTDAAAIRRKGKS